MFVAWAMAQHDGKVVNEKYLRDSVAIRKQLEEDFHGAGAIENSHSHM